MQSVSTNCVNRDALASTGLGAKYLTVTTPIYIERDLRLKSRLFSELIGTSPYIVGTLYQCTHYHI